MDRDDLIELLRQVDASLESPIEIVVVGGAAMILHFGAERATRDIDAIVLRGAAVELRAAARAVARVRDLDEDWLNDGVKGYSGILPPDFATRLTALRLGLSKLTVYALGRPDQAAMKIVALREQDLEDLELLLPPRSASELAVLRRVAEHLATFRPDWALKLRLFLEEKGWPID